MNWCIAASCPSILTVKPHKYNLCWKTDYVTVCCGLCNDTVSTHLYLVFASLHQQVAAWSHGQTSQWLWRLKSTTVLCTIDKKKRINQCIIKYLPASLFICARRYLCQLFKCKSELVKPLLNLHLPSFSTTEEKKADLILNLHTKKLESATGQRLVNLCRSSSQSLWWKPDSVRNPKEVIDC